MNVPRKLLKVAFLMQESRVMGGIEFNALHLASHFDRSRFKVVFICPEEGKLTEKLRESNLDYVISPRPPFFSTSFAFAGRYIFNPFTTLYNFLTFPIIAISLSSLMRREKFDLIVTKGLVANFYGGLAAKLSGTRCVWDMQEIVSGEKMLGLMRFVLNAWGTVFSNGIIVPSLAIKAQFWKANQNKTALIPNGVDTDFYDSTRRDRSKVRREWNIKQDEILIGHIARFTYWKGQKDFIRAAAEVIAQMPQAKFVVAGAPVFEDDSYEKEMKAIVEELKIGNNVFFSGFRDDLADVLAALDIFVHSSTEPEGCPLTLLMAMSMSKPVVATDILGTQEIMNQKNQGILVPPENPKALGNALLSIMKDSQIKQSMGSQARKRVLERYSTAAYASSSQEAYERFSKTA
jgi:glycosyltransferase involved in cell wall biosynthesis